MRRRNRHQIGGVGHCPTPPPPIDALGRANHVFVDTTVAVAGAVRTLVSLFCGAGGIDIGFHAAEFRTVLAVEVNEDAAATYQQNFPFCDLVLSDIRDLRDEEVLARLDGVEVDVLAAGWPCQGMSPAGDQDPRDPRNHLYLEVIRFARLLRPKVIVLENVPDLLGRKFRHLLDDLLARLADAGYPDASVMVLDAADYGVPQHRERVITIASRLGLANTYPLPLRLERYVSVRETITDLADSPDEIALNHLRIKHGASRVRKIGRLVPGESLNRGHSLSARRLIADQPANTVLWGHGTLLVHPWLDRTLTVREAARLQGIPDTHVLLGSQNAQGSQVGNAVPPPMARCIALAVRSMLDVGEGEDGAHEGVGRQKVTCESANVPPLQELEPVEANCHMPHPDLPVSHIIEGDNIDVMEALRRTHTGRVDAIWADPPYNTGKSESYRNSFGRGEWLRDVAERMVAARDLLTDDGVICVAIDHFELFALGTLMDSVFDQGNRLAIVSVVHNRKGRSGWDRHGFSEVNEYYLFYAKDAPSVRIQPLALPEGEVRRRFPLGDAEGRFIWHSLVRGGGRSTPAEAPDQSYPIYVDPLDGRMALSPFEGSVEVLPLAEDDSPRVWRCVPSTFGKWNGDGDVRAVRVSPHRCGWTIQKKTRANRSGGRGHALQPKTVWSDPSFNATAHGTKLLRRMIEPNPFSYPKSVYAVREALRAMVGHKPEALVLDIYAGSGTTGHAVLMMNAEDDGRRTFILVNNDEVIRRRGFPETRICEDICLPRIRAAIDGYEYMHRSRTTRVDGLPGNVRYLRMGGEEGDRCSVQTVEEDWPEAIPLQASL